MITTKLQLQDKLPLTCTRSGTCCHGNTVMLNPWEIACLAREKKITTREFRDQFTEFGGIRLKFNGKPDGRGKQACNLYIENFGCSVHAARPLVCRLFPIGRQIQNNEVNYIYQGYEFPCSIGCPDVVNLPYLSVGEYLEGQETIQFENAQDAYLDLMQNMADISFVLLLDNGLSKKDIDLTLNKWFELGNGTSDQLAQEIGSEWVDYLMLPEISDNLENPILFTQIHNDALQSKAEEKFEGIQSIQELQKASILMMGISLYLAIAIGTNAKSLSEHWIETAKNNGAKE